MEAHSFQKQNQYNKFLPYFEELEQQADVEFKEIVENLEELKKPILDVPKLSQWIQILEKYISKHGFRFNKENHVWLVNYFFDLLCGVKNIDKVRFEKICKMTHTLLGKDYLLNGNDLQLEWKPLAQLIEYYNNSPSSKRSLDIKPSFYDLIAVVRKAKPYFKKGCTQEMLKEWRPYLNIHNRSSMAKGTHNTENLPILENNSHVKVN